MKSAPRILLSHKSDARNYWFGEAATKQLSALGRLVLNDRNALLLGPDLRRAAAGATFIVLDRETPMGREDIEALPELIAIIRSGVDCSMVDLGAASNAGVAVVAAKPGYTESTAELALGLILAAARHIPRYDAEFHTGAPVRPRMGRELATSRIGIVGYGHVGRRLGRILRAIGSTVIVSDPGLTLDDLTDGESLAPLDDMLAIADIVVLTAPLNDRTRNLIDAGRLSRMRPDSLLVNAARGGLIDEDALEEALESGAIGAVAMDVGLQSDNLPSARFARFENVVATPHVGNLTQQGLSRQPLNTVENIKTLLRGDLPRTTLNPEHATRFHAWRAG